MSAPLVDWTVTTTATSGRCWWQPGYILPNHHRVVRLMWADEIALAKRIIASENPPLAWGGKMAKLIARDALT